MISAECDALRPELGAFADGELSGAEWLRVSQHVEVCERCQAEIGALTQVGDWVRTLPTGDDEVPGPVDGWASGLVSRARAESALSWRSVLEWAVDGWHWAVVGAGSVTGTLATTSIVALVLALGPAPEREDSLSALMTNLTTSPGMLFVYATPGGLGSDSMLMQVDNGEPMAPRVTAALALRDPNRRELVGALADVMTQGGRVVTLDSMSPDHRRYAESLLSEINRLPWGDATQAGPRVSVHEVRLITSTISVTAKGL